MSRSYVKHMVDREIRKHSEKKWLQTQNSAQSTNAGTIISFTEVPQGDTDVTRDGDQLTLRSLELSVDVVGLTGVTGNSQMLTRFIVFQWLPNTTPAASDVVISTDLGSGFAPRTFYNHQNRFEFRILHDRLFYTDEYHQVVGEHIMVSDFHNRKVQYTPGSTSTATNKLYMLVVSNQTGSTYAYNAKLNFSDM